MLLQVTAKGPSTNTWRLLCYCTDFSSYRCYCF